MSIWEIISQIILEKILGRIYRIVKFSYKKFYLWIKNAKFILYLKVTRIYIGLYNIDFRTIHRDFREIFPVKEIIYNENHLEVWYKDLQIPITLELHPEIDLESLSAEIPSNTDINNTEVLIKLKGFITCHFRDDEYTRKYLNRIERIIEILEKHISKTPKFTNVNIEIKKEPEDEYWFEKKRIKDEQLDLDVIVGKKTVQINSKNLLNVLEAVKKYIVLIY